MALKTQGSNLYMIDKDITGGPEVMEIGCTVSIDPAGATRDQLESTCLSSPARTYEPGLPTPQQLTFEINFDPADSSHKRVYDLWQSGEKFDMALAYSDGTAPPTLDTAGDFHLPSTRTYMVFHDCFIANVPQTLALNALVNAKVAVQLSGLPFLSPKSP